MPDNQQIQIIERLRLIDERLQLLDIRMKQLLTKVESISDQLQAQEPNQR